MSSIQGFFLYRRQIANPAWHYKAAVLLFSVVTFVHVLSLPLVVSYDGMEYIHLANLFFTDAFTSAWNYLRTPLFPLSLRTAFALGGEQPQAAMLVTVLVGFAGVLLTGSAVRTVAGNTAGACLVLLLTFYPVLVCYEHMLLSETGIFFFLSVLVWMLTQRRLPALPVLLALALAGGYYWRPTILYLSPVVVCVFLFSRYGNAQAAHPYAHFRSNLQKQWNRVLVDIATLVLLPWLLTAPWMHLIHQHPSTEMLETMTNGMYKQVMVPLDDPVNAPLREQYRAYIGTELHHGRLPLDGLSIAGQDRFLFIKKLSAVYIKTGLIKLIATHPGRYLTGVARCFIYFLGIPHHRADDENWQFSQVVFRFWSPSQNFSSTPGWIGSLKQFEAQPYTGGALIGKLFHTLSPLYTGLVLFSSLLSVWWLVISIWQGQATGLIMAGIPLAFLLLHALTMMSATRYIFPVYPLLMANSIIVMSLAIRGWRNKRMPDAQ